jgi:ABC-2 type transport system ATP-binding protein
MQVDEYLIETRELRRRFGPQVAVDDLDLLVPAAGVYGFPGLSGAGKTTAIRMLLGLIRPDAGEVRLFGQALNSNHRLLMGRVGALVEAP